MAVASSASIHFLSENHAPGKLQVDSLRAIGAGRFWHADGSLKEGALRFRRRQHGIPSPTLTEQTTKPALGHSLQSPGMLHPSTAHLSKRSSNASQPNHSISQSSRQSSDFPESSLERCQEVNSPWITVAAPPDSTSLIAPLKTNQQAIRQSSPSESLVAKPRSELWMRHSPTASTASQRNGSSTEKEAIEEEEAEADDSGYKTRTSTLSHSERCPRTSSESSSRSLGSVPSVHSDQMVVVRASNVHSRYSALARQSWHIGKELPKSSAMLVPDPPQLSIRAYSRADFLQAKELPLLPASTPSTLPHFSDFSSSLIVSPTSPNSGYNVNSENRDRDCPFASLSAGALEIHSGPTDATLPIQGRPLRRANTPLPCPGTSLIAASNGASPSPPSSEAPLQILQRASSLEVPSDLRKIQSCADSSICTTLPWTPMPLSSHPKTETMVKPRIRSSANVPASEIALPTTEHVEQWSIQHARKKQDEVNLLLVRSSVQPVVDPRTGYPYVPRRSQMPIFPPIPHHRKPVSPLLVRVPIPGSQPHRQAAPPPRQPALAPMAIGAEPLQSSLAKGRRASLRWKPIPLPKSLLTPVPENRTVSNKKIQQRVPRPDGIDSAAVVTAPVVAAYAPTSPAATAASKVYRAYVPAAKRGISACEA